MAEHTLPGVPLTEACYNGTTGEDGQYSVHWETRSPDFLNQDQDLCWYLSVACGGITIFGSEALHAPWFLYLAAKTCSGAELKGTDRFEFLSGLMACNYAMDIIGESEECQRDVPAVLLAYAANYLSANSTEFCARLRNPTRIGAGWDSSDLDDFVCASLFMAMRYICPGALPNWLQEMIEVGGAMFRVQLVMAAVVISPVIIDEDLPWQRSRRKFSLSDQWGDIGWLIIHSKHEPIAPPLEVENVRAFRAALTSILTEATVYEWAEEFATEFPGAEWPDYWLKEYLKLYFP